MYNLRGQLYSKTLSTTNVSLQRKSIESCHLLTLHEINLLPKSLLTAGYIHTWLHIAKPTCSHKLSSTNSYIVLRITSPFLSNVFFHFEFNADLWAINQCVAFIQGIWLGKVSWSDWQLGKLVKCTTGKGKLVRQWLVKSTAGKIYSWER